jgi:hypothetical protein
MKKIILAMVMAMLLIFALTVAVSAADYYVDDEGNVSQEKTDDSVYKFTPGNDRTIDGNKCFRVGTIYLCDTNATKIVFPVASDVKSGYSGIAPQNGWANSLLVYGLDANGDVITDENGNVSYAQQITEVEFLSGLDLDGANGKGAFSGFTALTTITVRGNLSAGGDAYTKGGFFANAPISEINIYGSGNIQLGVIRHINKNNQLKVVFHDGCTATVNLNLTRGYALPSNTVNNWQIVVNPSLTYTASKTTSDGSYDYSFYDKSVTGLTLTVAVPSKSSYEGVDLSSSHGLRCYAGDETPINATVATYCELSNTHSALENVSACADQCAKCLEFVALEAPNHSLKVVMEYANGYLSAGSKSTACENVGCAYCENGVEIAPLFTSKGYSQDENTNAIVLDFSVDRNAVKEYEQYLGTTISYGVVASLATDKYESSPLNNDATAKEGAFALAFEKTEYSLLQLKLTGIDKKDDALYLSGYVAFGGNLYYINGDEIATTALKVSYNNYTGIPTEQE